MCNYENCYRLIQFHEKYLCFNNKNKNCEKFCLQIKKEIIKCAREYTLCCKYKKQ